MKTTVIPGDFIGSFKIGDNIQRNIETLHLFYSYYELENKENRSLLLKPIITSVAFIIEAILSDWRGRVRGHTREKSVKIPDSLISIFQEKPNDQFGFYIDQAKKHNLFGNETKDICHRLATLKKLRNRVHIQNKENHFPRDEEDAFNTDAKNEAEYLLKYIFNYMLLNHSRPKGSRFSGDFIIPF